MLLLLAASLLGSGLQAEWTGLLVPAYFDPSREPDWNRLAAAAAEVPVIAIANVYNGPGTQATDGYRRVLEGVRRNGGRVIGYVSTSYARRSTNEVAADIDRWAAFYGLDGIFVDEMTNDGTTASLGYYRTLRDHARRQHPDWVVIGNPGTTTRESYLATPAADVLVTYENHTGYPTYLPDAWTRKYPATAVAHLCYEVGTSATMTQYLELARQRRVGWLYVTDDSGGNPWDRLPGYWEEEVSVVREQNRREPIQLTVVSGGSGALGLRVDSIPGRHVIEVSTDLITWEPFYAAGAPTGRLAITLTTAGVPARYFRARR